MSTNHKPATQLPYRVAMFHKGEWHVVGGASFLDDYPRAAICKREDDAYYLEHAANSYPRAVAVLKRYERQNTDIADLLREIGEA